MVSKGYGFSVSDVATVAAIAGVGFLVYKFMKSDAFGGISQTMGGVGAAVGGTGQGIGQIGSTTGDFFKNTVGESGETIKSVQDKIQELINNIGSKGSTNTTTPADLIDITKSKDNISRIQTTGSTAYGMQTVKVTSATGKTSTIIAAPKTYYPNLGIGFDKQGQGYSSAFAGKQTGAPVGANVKALFNANPKFN